MLHAYEAVQLGRGCQVPAMHTLGTPEDSCCSVDSGWRWLLASPPGASCSTCRGLSKYGLGGIKRTSSKVSGSCGRESVKSRQDPRQLLQGRGACGPAEHLEFKEEACVPAEVQMQGGSRESPEPGPGKCVGHSQRRHEEPRVPGQKSTGVLTTSGGGSLDSEPRGGAGDAPNGGQMRFPSDEKMNHKNTRSCEDRCLDSPGVRKQGSAWVMAEGQKGMDFRSGGSVEVAAGGG